MTDTSVADGQDDQPPPFRPQPPTPLSGIAQRAQPDVWQRGTGRTDQPTTVASLGPQPRPQDPVQIERPKGPQPWRQPIIPQRSQPDTPPLSPTGRPPPTRQFTPYIPSLPNRSFDQWGEPMPFARQPQDFEVGGIYHGVGNYFAGNGSGLTMLLGMGLGRGSAAFMDSYMKGREFAMKEQAADLKMQWAQLDRQQQQETDDYAEVFSTYNAVGYKPLNGVRIEDAIARVAMKYNDQNMLNVLAQGPGAAYRLLQNRDSHWQDGHAANTKAEAGAIEDAKWGLAPPGTSTTGADESGLPATLGAPAGAGGLPGAPGAAAPGAAATGDQSLIDEGATKIFQGIEPGTYVAPDVKNEMARRALQMNQKADAILRNPNIKPEDVIPEVERQLGPTIAHDLKGYSEYRAGPGATGQASGGKMQGYWDLLGDLAQKAKPGDPARGLPGWNKSTYQAQRDFREQAQKANSPVQRIPTSVRAANNVLNDLAAIQKKHGLISINSPEDLQGWMGKDDLFSQLKIDWIRYNEDIDVLTRGTPSVGMAEQAIQTQPQFPYLGSLSGYRAAVRRDMDQAQSRVDELHTTWNQYQTGDPMPGYNAQAEADMERVKKLDPQTGAKPGDVVPHPDGTKWRYLGVNPEDPDADENWKIVE